MFHSVLGSLSLSKSTKCAVFDPDSDPEDAFKIKIRMAGAAGAVGREWTTIEISAI